ncbi:MAG: hypothetical protein ABW217_05250, partial [Polyangiaceae bacterium]
MVRRALLGSLLAAFVGCSSDDDSETRSYSVTFINRTNAAYEVWVSTDSDDLGFQDTGEVLPSNGRLILNGRVVNVDYTYRFVEDGASVDAPSYEL